MGASQRHDYAAYLPGATLAFTLRTLQPDGSIETNDQVMTIERVLGGGFFGRVLLPQHQAFVVKTALPDPWHALWRAINWGLHPFPSQVDEAAAQLDHLAGRLIQRTLPILTSGRIVSPSSFGYTALPTGYAQVVERMHGRGPRFDRPLDEYAAFKRIQNELLDLGLRLGLEQVGQIHPRNPFGLANLWWDEQHQRWIWLDTLPAIRHTGWVWPAFYFSFHRELRAALGQSRPTFNRIHTNRFRAEIERRRSAFPAATYQAIHADLTVYDEVWQRLDAHALASRRDVTLVQSALAALGDDLVIAPARRAYTIATDPAAWRRWGWAGVRLLTEPEHRFRVVMGHTVLRGVEEAHRQGVIAAAERDQAWATVTVGEQRQHQRRRGAVLAGLQLVYLAGAYLLNLLEAMAYVAILAVDNKVALAMTGIVIGWVVPSFLRVVVTWTVGWLAHADLTVATRVAALPKVGAYLAVPAQLSYASPLIWHYAIRNAIARLSRLSPAGGWGSEYEARLWRALGRHVERLGQRR